MEAWGEENRLTRGRGGGKIVIARSDETDEGNVAIPSAWVHGGIGERSDKALDTEKSPVIPG